MDGIPLQDGENGTIITSEVYVDASGLFEVKKRFSTQLTVGQWKVMWCNAVFSFPGNNSRVMESQKIQLNNSFTKQNTFHSQFTSWKDLQLTTSGGLKFATDSSTMPAASTTTRSFSSAGLPTKFEISQSSTNFGPSINITSSSSPGPSSSPEPSFTNGLSTRERQSTTVQPLFSFGSSEGSARSTDNPIINTRLSTTMSWSRTITTDSTRNDEDAEDSVSLRVVVTVIVILVICTVILSCFIRYWQVRKKLNSPPPFKPPPPPIKYTGIHQGEVNS
ncbi:T-cell surface protein tactile-like [Narcine bancroftii]|uniref:T-cell surface protein tactile-like n=1 Tax=Narcine bancroftii TaxID=1343680 RepID=UPI00383179A8